MLWADPHMFLFAVLWAMAARPHVTQMLFLGFGLDMLMSRERALELNAFAAFFGGVFIYLAFGEGAMLALRLHSWLPPLHRGTSITKKGLLDVVQYFSGRIINIGTFFGARYGTMYCTIYGTTSLAIQHCGFYSSGAGKAPAPLL